MGASNLKEEELLVIQFLNLQNGRELADFLKIKYSQLIYNIHKVPDKDKYAVFDINKRSGHKRKIIAPVSAIKIIQKNISNVLYEIYKPRNCVHGYTRKRSIKSNASVHSNQRYILNIDLKDFFPSINFGRVRGLFMAQPFKFNHEVATILAQICCFENMLPQGAPTSPIISNFICYSLDKALLKIATENDCYYTRYSDDITFSTSHKRFPESIIYFFNENKVILAEKLLEIISSNGFNVNDEKVKLQSKFQRQVVTGLTVNTTPNVTRKYIRRVRAMLNAWKKYGLENAQNEYYLKYDKKYRNPKRKRTPFMDIVIGRVNFIRTIRKNESHLKENEKDKLSLSLKKRLEDLIKYELSIPKHSNYTSSTLPLIVTEGKTDWMHIENAFKYHKKESAFKELGFEFWKHEDKEKMNDIKLKAFCRKQAHQKNGRKIICVFDSDNPEIIKEMGGEVPSLYKSWGNNVFSFCIPTPSARKDYKNISIEFYYSDDEIHTIDLETGRQLLFTNEVIEQKNLIEKEKTKRIIKLNTPLMEFEFEKKILTDKLSLIFDSENNGIAHSKYAFAKNICDSKMGFDKFDLREFEKIFSIIETIIGSKE